MFKIYKIPTFILLCITFADNSSAQKDHALIPTASYLNQYQKGITAEILPDVILDYILHGKTRYPSSASQEKMYKKRLEIHIEIPSRFDWREKGIMTPVKNQMDLGSCGVFAAVAVFEALIKKETGKTVDLSEQQVINICRDFVPSGISSVDAMKYMKQYGLVLEVHLPYQDKKTEKMPEGPADYLLTDYHDVQTDKMALSEKIRTIKQAVLKYGPVATNMIFYQDLDRYKKGIYIYDGKSEEQGGHWVVIIGWENNSGVKNGGYWICRNSWGENWGANGYFNIAYGECGIDDFWFVYGIYKK